MIYTVNGPIEKVQMGRTLAHEHFKWETDEEYANQMYFDHKYRDDCIQNSVDRMLPLVQALHASGCKNHCGRISADRRAEFENAEAVVR